MKQKALNPSQSSSPTFRYPFLDSWRGITIILMVLYHLCFDLNQFGLTQFDMNNTAFWLNSRAFIVTSFLLLVGICLVLGHTHGDQHYWQRIVKISVCALLVTIATMQMFPQSYVFFGILHFIALASLIFRPLVNHQNLQLGLGLVFILVGLYFSHPLFDTPYLQWVGLMTFKPITEDYVPMLPWFGVVCFGMAAGHHLLKNGRLHQFVSHTSHANSVLGWLGKKSLIIYMVHQPILMAILWLAVQLFKGY